MTFFLIDYGYLCATTSNAWLLLIQTIKKALLDSRAFFMV